MDEEGDGDEGEFKDRAEKSNVREGASSFFDRELKSNEPEFICVV